MPQVQCEIAGRKFSISTGDIAFQSDGAALVKYGDTSVLVTVCVSQSVPSDTPFLPLTVDYQEKAGAAGRIPGGYYKREGKPHETEIVTARLIDRPVRPLFAKDFLHNVQVTAIVFSADQENHPDVPAIIGASFALLVAGLPFNGPIGAVRIGQIGRELVVNPTVTELETSTLDMVVAGTKEGITMIEASAYEVDEPTVFEALEIAHTEIIRAIELQEELLDSVDITPFEYTRVEIDPTIKADIERKYKDAIIDALNHTHKKDRHHLLEKIWFNIREEYPDNPYVTTIVEEIKNTYIRELILKERRRLDGRKPTDVRPISCEVSILPRVHGSALFTRGETQSLAVTTLGTAADEQHVEELTGESWKTFMLHYNFPPFSTGEAAPLKAPRRREIGHGRLAEKALQPILPASEAFPYTIRVVSDILSSNGSSSMATVCAGSLSLMDAGVPTKTHVAGIAMGLVDDVILTDILGEEDHAGDMDFKVAGTRDGITAIQL
ncbi:polyribonucleotide nucleotidyltransferase, partial [candidate division bacterium WOR-3 4484_18]